MNIKSFAILVVLSLAGCQSAPTKTDADSGGPEHGFLPPPVWNASMQNLKQEMMALEPYIFDRAEFNDPKNHDFLQKEIHKLAGESKNVKHDPVVMTKDPTVRFVATQFADELQKADENFTTGWHEFSRWQLAKVTSFCLECHTRSREGVAYNPQSTARPYLTTLPAPERIEFMVAFRQFEAAYNLAIEKLKEIQSNNQSLLETDRIARLALLISVQYMQNIEKSKKVVEVIEKNSTLPLFLKKSNRLWKKSLSRWQPNDTLYVLPDVRSLLNSRVSEIEDMRAIPALLRILTEGLSQDELGEALYLTGESYESLNTISKMSLHENYYESCVRKAPRTKWAKLCYRKYSDSVTASYTGSGGTRIPKDIKNRMDELKDVIEKSNVER